MFAMEFMLNAHKHLGTKNPALLIFVTNFMFSLFFSFQPIIKHIRNNIIFVAN